MTEVNPRGADHHAIIRRAMPLLISEPPNSSSIFDLWPPDQIGGTQQDAAFERLRDTRAFKNQAVSTPCHSLLDVDDNVLIISTTRESVLPSPITHHLLHPPTPTEAPTYTSQQGDQGGTGLARVSTRTAAHGARARADIPRKRRRQPQPRVATQKPRT